MNKLDNLGMFQWLSYGVIVNKILVAQSPDESWQIYDNTYMSSKSYKTIEDAVYVAIMLDNGKG